MKTNTIGEGQLQLFGVARVILRARARREGSRDPGGRLLINEVSSKIDKKTEELMMRVLKRGFASYMFSAVAQRLERRKLWQV